MALTALAAIELLKKFHPQAEISVRITRHRRPPRRYQVEDLGQDWKSEPLLTAHDDNERETDGR